LKILFAQEPDTTISTNTTWEAGEYTYNNILITSGATLTLNGTVTISARNLTIDPSSSLSADGKGYPAGLGPGAGTAEPWTGGSGAGYGGKGGIGIGQRTSGPTYGSAKAPIDLGSGGAAGIVGNGGSGGGAIKLVISENLTVNGVLSANGQDAPGSQSQAGGGSGGSVYVIAKNFSGTGAITASGGNGGPWGSGYGGGGGGGRIAIYYQASNFTGEVEARGGIGNGNNSGEPGTVGFFDTTNNYFYSGHNWRFQENDLSFEFNKIFLKGSSITSEGSVSIYANDLLLENCNLLISETETFNINNLSLINSAITPLPQAKIDLNLKNLNLDANSCILANGKGYPAGFGPGAGKASTWGGSGAGYGGKGGAGGTLRVEGGETYGHDIMPLDFGSGGDGALHSSGAGGGAVKLTISDTLTFNGIISANGQDALQAQGYQDGGGSGGSIYIIAKNFNGAGLITANGGKSGSTGGGAAGGGGGGGRIAIYFKTSSFTGKVEAKGGVGVGNNGEDGTVVVQVPSLDSPLTLFTLAEKSSSLSNSAETFSSQRASLNNDNVTGDLNGTISFSDFEIVSCATGPFSGKGFTQGNLSATLEGISYDGSWKGVTYLIPSEKRIYLKGEISGDIIGVVEGYLMELVPESGIYDKYQATWKINRLGTTAASATINLDGVLSYQPTTSFNSEVYLYQANMEGVAFGFYAGPLNAVVTHLRLTGDNEYKGQGFSIISYSSSLGQGEAYSYNRLISEGKVDFSGLFEAPILGKLSALLDEAATPKTLSGTIERMNFGVTPQSDLNVSVWSAYRVSPGEKINYIIEYRNDGLKSAAEAIVYDYLDPLVNYISASQNAYYDPYAHQVSWNLGALPAKSVGYLSIQVEIPWGLPAHVPLENRAYIFDITLHSTDENGFCNGIRFNSENQDDTRIYTQFKSTNNAIWFKLYDKTNEFTGSLESYLASKDDSTARNGVGETSEIIGNRPKWIGYSGGATTIVTQAKNNRLSGNELYLISPQLVTQADLQAIKSKFGKIVIYQGDDLIPDSFNLIFLAASGFDDKFSKSALVYWAKRLNPPDNKIEDLISKIETSAGNKTFDYLKIFPKEAGNRIEITWKDGGATSFLTTNDLQPEEGIEIVPMPGIKHDEWVPLLNKFEEKYHRWPTGGDLVKLKDMLDNDIRKGGKRILPQEIMTANDPNEILVSPEGDVRPGDELTYTINYENIGEGIAFGVYITDTLEEDLKDSTLVINNGGSYDSSTRTLSWFIGEVGPSQKGSVSFKIKVKADALDKSEVINFATIFFPSVPQETRTNGAVNRITTSIDNVPPTTTATPSILPNQAGWNNSNVTINLTATDNEGGSGVAKTEYSFDGANWVVYANPFSIISEGPSKVYYRSTDNTGNIESPKSLELKIDKTLPKISANSLPQPNTNGWNNTDVVLNFTATDIPSGIASVTGPTTVTTEGKDQQIGGQAIDLADNIASASVTLNIDKTPPVISLTLASYQIQLPFKYNDTSLLLPYFYKLVYSARDNLSGLKNIKAGLTTPDIATFKQQFIKSPLINIVLDEQRRLLIIMAPNPAEILDQLKNKLLLISNNQVMYLNLRPNTNLWTITKLGQFLIITAPSISFKAEASDYAGNISTANTQYPRNKILLPEYLKALINNKKLSTQQVQELMEDAIIDQDTLKIIWQKYKIKY